MAGFWRWVAILLLARAVLPVVQLHSEREGRAHADDPPAWSPDHGRCPLVTVLPEQPR